MKIIIFNLLALLILSCDTPSHVLPQKAENKTIIPSTNKQNKMKVQDVFVLICTDKMSECRDYYVTNFGFELSFESTIYTQLTIPSENGGAFSLALMPPDNPFTAEFKDVFNGKGAYVTIQVEHADTLYKRLKESGAPIITDIYDAPWGQRHFVTKDPNGTIVDVVQSIDVVDGYYDKYQVKGN
jgi:uncharacterized glyoxalase superfamily protein PhnB